MHVGIAHHLGWAVAVTASANHDVADRRRIELVEPGMPTAPIHHEGRLLDHAGVAALVAQVRAVSHAGNDGVTRRSRGRRTGWDRLDLDPSLAVGLPTDVAVQRCAPYEARADSVMYREVVVEVAHARGWTVHVYDAGAVESQAIAALGEHGEGFLHRPRAVLGPPWTKDHRLAFAAAIVAGVGWH